MERSAIRDSYVNDRLAPDFAALQPGYDGEALQIRPNYFGSCLGIMPFSFSISLIFIFMPPGITISPGF
jgi:hypothetical protein